MNNLYRDRRVVITGLGAVTLIGIGMRPSGIPSKKGNPGSGLFHLLMHLPSLQRLPEK